VVVGCSVVVVVVDVVVVVGLLVVVDGRTAVGGAAVVVGFADCEPLLHAGSNPAARATAPARAPRVRDRLLDIDDTSNLLVTRYGNVSSLASAYPELAAIQPLPRSAHAYGHSRAAISAHNERMASAAVLCAA